ncbi:hypothetical protein Mgra_00009815 [Meloidogyne graminicola]|uniref:L-Fucosyltransferase n=1 Tax=Meloidogyne graminicola TaxID=189291 RepID=A0A8S9ZD81_9BILA|nr:hypothetical protein Mgra_00009815 [Meloidogyne graminicola]
MFIILFKLFFIFALQINENNWKTKQELNNYNNNNWSEFLLNFNYETKEKIEPEFNDFIYTNVMLGQMGNQLYRFASLYAIGKYLKRTPVYLHNETELLKMENELSRIFPNFFKRIYYLKHNFNRTEKFRLIDSCCDYINPEIILQTNHSKTKGLKLAGGPTLINYKYFHHMRDDIIKIFKFNDNLILNISNIWNNFISNNSSLNNNNLCVHIRVGDFVGIGESKSEQILAANFNNIYIISELNLTRGEELCLAHIVCDSFLHSAPLSTFGFWMAYLLKENTPVFTIHKQIKMHPFYFDTVNNLPPEWFQIEEKDLLLF